MYQLMLGSCLQMRLSDTASVAIKMPLTGRNGQPIQAVLTQQDFERLSADLFRRARLPLDEACWQVLPLSLTARHPLIVHKHPYALLSWCLLAIVQCLSLQSALCRQLGCGTGSNEQ